MNETRNWRLVSDSFRWNTFLLTHDDTYVLSCEKILFQNINMLIKSEHFYKRRIKLNFFTRTFQLWFTKTVITRNHINVARLCPGQYECDVRAILRTYVTPGQSWGCISCGLHFKWSTLYIYNTLWIKDIPALAFQLLKASTDYRTCTVAQPLR